MEIVKATPTFLHSVLMDFNHYNVSPPGLFREFDQTESISGVFMLLQPNSNRPTYRQMVAEKKIFALVVCCVKSCFISGPGRRMNDVWCLFVWLAVGSGWVVLGW